MQKVHKRSRVVSGMRPTGPLHLGHLIGALENWQRLQEEHDCFFFVADWHALMSEYENPSVIRKYSTDNVIDWLSFGIDPNRSVVFRQSDVKEHLDLMMFFSMLTPLSWLERCPTYKEQLKELEGRELTTYGFLGYPVLQAADILLYKAEYVPVGEDQLPHLELTREIGRRFNTLYKKEVFPDPKALLTKDPRLVGLDKRKMSKSYNNFIALSDPPDVVKKKVSMMITDPTKIKKGDPGDPVKNECTVFAYHTIFARYVKIDEATVMDIEKRCKAGSLGCVDCKKALTDMLLRFLHEKIQKKRGHYTEKHVESILKKGADKAREIAVETIKDVRKSMGL